MTMNKINVYFWCIICDYSRTDKWLNKLGLILKFRTFLYNLDLSQNIQHQHHRLCIKNIIFTIYTSKKHSNFYLKK